MADTAPIAAASVATDAQGMAEARQVADRATGRALGKGKHMDDAAIEKTAKDFEAVFLGQMLQHMWEGVEVDPYTGGGHAEETFRGIMVEEQAKAITRAGGIGLAATIKDQIIRMQDGPNATTTRPTPAHAHRAGAEGYSAAQAALAQHLPVEEDAPPASTIPVPAASPSDDT